MQEAAKKFIGEHDFRNFCKMDAANVNNYKRHITIFDISSSNKRLIFYCWTEQKIIKQLLIISGGCNKNIGSSSTDASHAKILVPDASLVHQIKRDIFNFQLCSMGGEDVVAK